MDTQICHPAQHHFFAGPSYDSTITSHSTSAPAPTSPMSLYHQQGQRSSSDSYNYSQLPPNSSYSSSLMLQVRSAVPAPHEDEDCPPDQSQSQTPPRPHPGSLPQGSLPLAPMPSSSSRESARGTSRPLTQQEQDNLAHLDRLKFFLATAPSRWSDAEVSALDQEQSGTSFPIGHPQSNHPALNRFLLPNHEYVSCVLWGGLYHITGTDIVRALVFRFEAFGRPVRNMKKFEEGVFSDLRNLKPGVDACLEEPKSPFLDLLFKYQCIRTQKKQKVFYWFSVPHDRLFLDALERDLKREKMGAEPTTVVVGEPAASFTYDHTRSLYDQFSKAQGGVEGEGELEAAVRRADALKSGSPAEGQGDPEADGTDPAADSTDEQASRNGATAGSALRGPNNPFFSAFSLFEGSPSYKQRRKKTTKSTRKTPLRDDQSTRPTDVTVGYGPSDSDMSAADMFFAQARGEMSPANPIEKEQERRIKIAQETVAKVEAMNASIPPLTQASYPPQAHAAVSRSAAVDEDGIIGVGGSSEDRPRVERGYSHPMLPTNSYADFQQSSGATRSATLPTESCVPATDAVNGLHPSGMPKTFVCPLFSCGRLFKRMEHLKRHLRTHTMERPFQCNRCQKRFSRSDNLAQHTRIHLRADADGATMGADEGYADIESEDIDELEGDDGSMSYVDPRMGYVNGVDGMSSMGSAAMDIQGNVMGLQGVSVDQSNTAYIDGAQDVYYVPEAPSAVGTPQFAYMAGSPEHSPYLYGDARNQPSPAFTSASAPSPPPSHLVGRANSFHSTQPPPFAYPEYGHAVSMSAPSHKMAFDQSTLYPPSMEYAGVPSVSGPARRYRSATPSMLRVTDGIRRPSSATSYAAAGARGYHPYAMAVSNHYSQSAHSSPANRSVSLDYMHDQSAPAGTIAQGSHSRQSSNGQLQEQMSQMINFDHLEPDVPSYTAPVPVAYGETYPHRPSMQYSASAPGSYASPRNGPPSYGQAYPVDASQGDRYVAEPASYYSAAMGQVEPQVVM